MNVSTGGIAAQDEGEETTGSVYCALVQATFCVA